MNRKRFTKGLSSGLALLATFALLISLNDNREVVLAADDPAKAAPKSAQPETLEIPGSFKDLSSRDRIAAKRPANEITPAQPTGSSATPLEIDSSKLDAGYAESEMEVFHATAYCLKGRTASGATARPGMIAADPSVLPIGTVVHLRAGEYTGTYTVMDTGGRIKGRRVDVYVPSYREARQFGRRQVKIKVIGRGSHKPKPTSSVAASVR